MSGITLREIARVLEAAEAAARAGFEPLERVEVDGRAVRVAWSYDAGLETVGEWPSEEDGEPVAVADVWLSSNDGCLKFALWHDGEQVGGRHLDGVPVADLVAAWERLYADSYAGELDWVAA